MAFNVGAHDGTEASKAVSCSSRRIRSNGLVTTASAPASWRITARLVSVHPGQEHETHRREAGLRAHPAAEFEPVHARHEEIHQRDGRTFGGEQRNGGLRTRCADDAMPGVPQDDPQQLARALVVVDDHDQRTTGLGIRHVSRDCTLGLPGKPHGFLRAHRDAPYRREPSPRARIGRHAGRAVARISLDSVPDARGQGCPALRRGIRPCAS